MRAQPRRGEQCRQRPLIVLRARQRRQVQDRERRRWRGGGHGRRVGLGQAELRGHARARAAQNQGTRFRLLDARNFKRLGAAAKSDAIAGLKRQMRGAEFDPQTLRARAPLRQHDLRQHFGRLRLQHDRRLDGLDAAFGIIAPARAHARQQIIAARIEEPHSRLDRRRSGVAALRERVRGTGGGELADVDIGRRGGGAMEEHDLSFTLDRAETIGRHQRRQRAARAGGAVDDVAAHRARERRYIQFRDTGARADIAHHLAQTRKPGAPVEPMAEPPRRAVSPHIRARRKRRMRTRIPAPEHHLFDHALAVYRRDRIVGAGDIPMLQICVQRAALDQIIARASGKRRQRTLGALGIDEQVWRVGAFIDRRTSQFDKPDRLRLRHPGGGRRRPARRRGDHSARAPRNCAHPWRGKPTARHKRRR